MLQFIITTTGKEGRYNLIVLANGKLSFSYNYPLTMKEVESEIQQAEKDYKER